MGTDAHSYRDPGRLAAWSRAVLWLQALLAALATAFALSSGPGFDDDPGGNPFWHLIRFVMFLLFVGGGVIVLRWIYVANANARALGSEGMATSPGLAVGAYFIPIANLFLPFASMREIWKASGQDRDWEAAPSSPLIGGWWLFWLVTCITGLVAFRLAMPEYAEEAGRLGEQLEIASDLANIPASLLLAAIIGRVTAMQRDKARA